MSTDAKGPSAEESSRDGGRGRGDGRYQQGGEQYERRHHVYSDDVVNDIYDVTKGWSAKNTVSAPQQPLTTH